MEVEFDQVVDTASDLSARFHGALEAYSEHRHDDQEPVARRALAQAYSMGVPENPLDPSRVLSSIHWRAIARCAEGHPYAEEERKTSPFETIAIHTKKLRVYISDGAQWWNVLKLFVQNDGSFHRINKVEHLMSNRRFHYSLHPSGVVHDTDEHGHIRSAALYWNNFRELDISPIDGIGLWTKSFRDASVDDLKLSGAPVAGLTFLIPDDTQKFFVQMWLGKRDVLRDPISLRKRMVPVASDRIERIEYFPMATFRDPGDGFVFDIDFAVAQVVRAEDRMLPPTT